MIVALLGVGRVIDGRGLEVEVQHAPCVRLFHSNGDVGCRTESREGVVGALLAVENYEQLREIEKIDLLQYGKSTGMLLLFGRYNSGPRRRKGYCTALHYSRCADEHVGTGLHYAVMRMFSLCLRLCAWIRSLITCMLSYRQPYALYIT